MKLRKFNTMIFILAMLTVPISTFAAEGLKGDAFYAKGQFKEAIASYHSVINEGKQSAALFYNLGNAYFKLGELAPAILYYEKARRLSPGDEDINHNIRFANARTVDKIEEAPEFFLTTWWTALILIASADNLAIVTVLLVFIGSLLLITYFFSRNIAVKKTTFFGAVAFFLAGIFTVFTAQSQLNYFNDNKQAIVFASVANVKSTPAAQASTTFVLHEGAKLNLKESSGEYTRVTLANGNEGWIRSTDFKEI